MAAILLSGGSRITMFGLLLSLAVTVGAQDGVIAPDLQAALRCAHPDQTFEVIVGFSDAVDVRDEAIQTLVKSAGAGDVIVLWINNSIAATLPAAGITALAPLPEVENIRLDAIVTVPPPPDDGGGSQPDGQQESGCPDPDGAVPDAEPPQAAFEPPLPVTLSAYWVRDVLIADFDGDGVKDALLWHRNGQSRQIGGYFGEGDKPFEKMKTFFLGDLPGPIALGDFNEDGILDLVAGAQGERWGTLVIGNVCGSDLSANQRLPVLLGDGDGGFAPQTPCLVMETTSTWDDRYIADLLVADVNEDHHDDIIVSRTGNVGERYIATFFGNGDGTFSEPQKIVLNRPQALHAGDFDGDALVDLLFSNDRRTYLYRGDGQGNFAPLALDFRGPDWLVGDVNQDAALDLIFYSPQGSELTVSLGNGDGSFADNQTLTLDAWNVSAIQLADLNADGYPELVLVSEFSPEMQIFYGTGGGRFVNKPHRLAVEGGKKPVNFAVEDFNNDNRLDLFVIFNNYPDQAAGVVLFQAVPSAVEESADTAPPPVNEAPPEAAQ